MKSQNQFRYNHSNQQIYHYSKIIEVLLKYIVLQFLKVENFEALTGKGVTGMLDGKKIALGNNRLADDLRWEWANLYRPF